MFSSFVDCFNCPGRTLGWVNAKHYLSNKIMTINIDIWHLDYLVSKVKDIDQKYRSKNFMERKHFLLCMHVMS